MADDDVEMISDNTTSCESKSRGVREKVSDNA